MVDAERTMVFIDGSNFYHIIKDIYKIKSVYKNSEKLINFNFEQFVNYIAKDKKLIRTYYYTAPLDKNKDEETYKKQQQFFEKLKKIPNFELILCRMQKDKTSSGKEYTVKEDDIHIAVDMVKLACNNAYDTAILVSTDGDFVPAIEATKEMGKRVENIGFEIKFSWHLKQKCDRFTQLNKSDLDKFFS